MSEADVDELLNRCNRARPAQADLAQLRAYVSTRAAPLAALSFETICDGMLGDTPPGPLAVVRGEVDRLMLRLGYKEAPGMERAIIEHIATCWVRLQLAERALSASTEGSHLPATGAYREKRLTEAQRRYLRALGLLAKLRQFAPAQVQVNIANVQQVVNE